MFVTETNDELIGTFNLRDLIVAQPKTIVSEIMKSEPLFLYDNQKVEDIAELISKYNLLAVPVINSDHKLVGMVVIDDILEDLIRERRTRKRN
jgi:magnesium transporter